jgi:hypothetical protein
MRGRPLAFLIDTRVRLSNAGKTPASVPKIIRDVMSDVEGYARFQIPRFLRCYLDVLAIYARLHNREKDLQHLPDLELWLELGVSVRTALALMELGLSRTSAIEIFELMTNADMDKSEVITWLKSRDIEAMDLPAAVRTEIRRALLKLEETPDSAV